MRVDNINNINAVEFVKNKAPDLIYCLGFSQLIGKEIIEIPKKGIIGFHPTQLPSNRGRHPLIWALTLGLEQTASTFFYIDEGDILSQEIVPIFYEDDANQLYNRVLEVAKKQIEEFTNNIEVGNVCRVKQSGISTNYWRKRTKKDGEIDWRMSSYNIYNLVRALTHPYIGAHFVYKSKDIKVWKVKEKKLDGVGNIEPGKIIEVFPDSTFIVKTGENCIHVLDYDKFEVKVGEYL